MCEDGVCVRMERGEDGVCEDGVCMCEDGVCG